MKIVITGGSGFIGQAARRIAEERGIEVMLFDRPYYDVLMGLDRMEGADAVVHLAGVLGTSELFDSAEEAVNVNVIGSLRVMEYCAKHGIQYTGITMPPVFQSVYTATKVCADRLATAWHLSKGLKCSKVRAFNAYGPGQKHGPKHPQKILPTFATEAWAGRPIPIWGDGTQGVDLVHVDDLGRMLIDATQFSNDEVFDGGCGVSVSVNDVAAHVLAITGSTAGVTHLHMRAGEVPTQIVAQGEGWDKLAWKPRGALQLEGRPTPEFDWSQLEETVHFYKPKA